MHKSLLSPDTDTFSTPPSTPGPESNSLRASLSRKGSRPSSLLLEEGKSEYKPDILIEESSPNFSRKPNGTAIAPNFNRDQPTNTPRLSSSTGHTDSARLQHAQRPLDSPCFVHAFLDKGLSVNDWIRTGQQGMLTTSGARSADAKESNHPSGISSPTSAPDSVIESTDEDDEFNGNLTKHLAETAVGVREMSKQLGRTRVRSNIQSVLIITKARDNRLIKLTKDLAVYLMLKKRSGQKRGLIVYVDNQLRKSKRFNAEGIRRKYPDFFVPFPTRRSSSTTSLSSSSSNIVGDYPHHEEGQLRYWTMDMCSKSPHLFDFVVTLGGDGTVLFTSWLFQRIVPPVLPFALGSLGFLTNFDFNDHRTVMDSVIDNGIRVNLRMRFTCTIYRAVHEESKGMTAVKKAETGEIMMKSLEKDGWEALESGWNNSFAPADISSKAGKDKEIMCFTTRPVEQFEVLNELVVDRGPSSYLSLLELFGDEHHMTTVQADGLTVSTPTGSTAYSLSAGGSLVHPEIPALLITPICPHTLSFRPMLLPDTMELRICVPFNSRTTAWASFDGRGRVELKQGDHIKVTASKFPFPTVCADNQSTDWFHAISRTLRWNERERQKSFVVVEEGPVQQKKRRHNKAPVAPHVVVDDEDDEDDISDEDDGTFDIDSSAEADQVVAQSSAPQSENSEPEHVGRQKAQEEIVEDQVHRLLATSALRNSRRASNSRSRSRSAMRSGGSNGNPSSAGRHVEFQSDSYGRSKSVDMDQNGTKDDTRSTKKPGVKSRIAREKDIDFESAKTPTVAAHHRNRSRSADFGRRAFAVWGHDESDSNASDSDTSYEA